MSIRRLVWYVEAPLTFSGGGERLLLEGIKHFTKLGIETALFAAGAPVDSRKLFNGAYQPHVLVSVPLVRKSAFWTRIPVIRHFFRLWRDAEVIAGFKPDYLIANSQYSSALLLKMKAMGQLRGIPFACFIHGSLFQFRNDREKYAWIFSSRFHEVWNADPVYVRSVPERIPPMPLRSRLKMEFEVLFQYLGVRRSSCLFVLTGKNQREMRLFYRHENVRIAHGAFPRSIFEYRKQQDLKSRWGFSGRPTVISICRLEEKKQVDLILRGFAAWRESNPRVALVIGGTGGERASLERLAGELGVANDVHFAGFIPDSELFDCYLSADVFTSADIADYDITTLVALALGKKAVVSTQHDFDENLAGLNQLFHAQPDPEGFGRGFAGALAAPPPCDQGLRASLLEAYTWEAYFRTVRAEMENARASDPGFARKSPS